MRDNFRTQVPAPATKQKREPRGSRSFLWPKLSYQRLFIGRESQSVAAASCSLLKVGSTLAAGGGAGVGVAAGVDSVAGACSVAGAGAGVGLAAGGGFTGAEEADGVLVRDGAGEAGSLPAALRTAETNASEAWGAGTDPVSMDLKSTIRPYSSRVASSSCLITAPFSVRPANKPRARE